MEFFRSRALAWAKANPTVMVAYCSHDHTPASRHEFFGDAKHYAVLTPDEDTVVSTPLEQAIEEWESMMSDLSRIKPTHHESSHGENVYHKGYHKGCNDAQIEVTVIYNVMKEKFDLLEKEFASTAADIGTVVIDGNEYVPVDEYQKQAKEIRFLKKALNGDWYEQHTIRDQIKSILSRATMLTDKQTPFGCIEADPIRAKLGMSVFVKELRFLFDYFGAYRLDDNTEPSGNYEKMYREAKDDYLSTLDELQESKALLKKCKEFIENNVRASDVHDVDTYRYLRRALGTE